MTIGLLFQSTFYYQDKPQILNERARGGNGNGNAGDLTSHKFLISFERDSGTVGSISS